MCSLSILHPIDSLQCIGSNILSGVGSVVSSAFSSIFGGIVKWLSGLITDAVAWMLKTLGTFWVKIGTPSVGDLQNNPSSTIGWMWGHLGWYTSALLLFSILLGAGRMMLARRSEPGVDTAKSVMQYVVVSSAGLAITTALIEASDEFSSWIISQATGADFGTSIGNLLAFNAATTTIGLVLIVIMGLIAVLASLLQIVLMVMRSAMLILLTTVQPLAAAATNTEMGKQWFKKVVAWTIAFILYKPVASIIYALAFRLITDSSMTTGDGLVNLIMGMTMMVLALLGLPALMRFLVPAVSAVSGGSGAGAMAAGAIATGAVMVATSGASAGASGAKAGSAGAGAGSSSSGGGGGGSGGGGGGQEATGAGPTGGGGGGGGGGGAEASGAAAASPTSGGSGGESGAGSSGGGGGAEVSAPSGSAGSGGGGSSSGGGGSAPSAGGAATPAGGGSSDSGGGSGQAVADADVPSGGASTGTSTPGSTTSSSSGAAASGSRPASRRRKAGAATLQAVGQRAGRGNEIVQNSDNDPSGSSS